jgi:hypothetical protein
MSTLTQEQRSALVAELNRSHAMLLDAARGLNEAQMQWRSEPGRWSVAECLEHVALVEQLLGQRMQRIVSAQEDADAPKRLAGRELLAREIALDRANKRQAPEPARPTGRFRSLDEFDAHFAPLRLEIIRFVETTDAPLHTLVDAHPAFGDLSGHQWLCFLSAHTERHAAQAREVREAPGFPPSDVPS